MGALQPLERLDHGTFGMGTWNGVLSLYFFYQIRCWSGETLVRGELSYVETRPCPMLLCGAVVLFSRHSSLLAFW